MQTNYPQPRYFVCSLTTQAARKLLAYYNRVLAPLGLTAQQAMALGVLWREENISLGVFAKRAGIGKAAAVSMIKRLEGMGLVASHSNPRDARLNVLQLTDKAWDLVPTVTGLVNALEERIEAALGKANVETVIEGLKKIQELDP